jgi:hypothetical protein
MPVIKPAKARPVPASPERRHVFISYSHADRDWVERLKRMMAPLLRGCGQELRMSDDSQIEAGRNWREAIEVALAQARVAVLLVSDHVLASEIVMGSPIDVPGRRDSEGPQRRVRLDGFLMGQTPITQAQWRAVARKKPPLV